MLTGSAVAENPAPHFDQPLTLVQLTDLALSNNPSTKIAWAEIRSSEAGVELARAGYWPQLTVGYGYAREKSASLPGQSSAAGGRLRSEHRLELAPVRFRHALRHHRCR